ncbi:MAG TPA: hypothetical protein VFP76_01900 [Gemmatimonadota bacterium]|nr:hypothetical protein [Gemmatimonadota bacterium]
MRNGLSDITVERDERNRPLKGHGVTEGGRTLGFTVQARRTVGDTVSVELAAWEGTARMFRMEVEMIPDRRISQRADCTGLALEWTMDFSPIRGARLAHITGQINGRPVHGDFDYLDETTTVNVSLDHWLPDALKERISALGPLLKSLSMELVAEPSGSRAVSWALARAGTAASCATSGGIGCLAAGFAFAYAAAICGELVVAG